MNTSTSIAIIIGTLGSLGFSLAWATTKVKLEKARTRVASRVWLVEDGRRKRKNLDRVIGRLRSDIEILRDHADECLTADVLRARLTRVLQGPVGGDSSRVREVTPTPEYPGDSSDGAEG